MTLSIVQAIGAVGLVMVSTAAVPMCSKDNGGSASTQSAGGASVATTSATMATTTAGPGLPADFPVDPALTPCKPVIAGPEVICDWHGVDGHQAYAFYIDALPKAGYEVDPGSVEGNMGLPSYRGAIRFKKGSVVGAVNISGGFVSMQLFMGQ